MSCLRAEERKQPAKVERVVLQSLKGRFRSGKGAREGEGDDREKNEEHTALGRHMGKEVGVNRGNRLRRKKAGATRPP